MVLEVSAGGAETSCTSGEAPGQLGAGQIASVDGPLTNDTITYTYDELGRVVSRAINGAANTVTWAFDALGRATTEMNVLGTFTYAYDGVTNRLATLTYPNGQSSSYSYLPEAQEHRLQTIHHKYPGGATLSKFDYTYDAVGNILTWQQQADSAAPTRWRYAYDRADQLLGAVQETSTPTPTVLHEYAYGYDPAGNRLYEQVDDGVKAWTHDALNRLQVEAGGGVLQVRGTVNEPATVTIQGLSAAVSTAGQFTGRLPVVPGTNVFSVTATDPSGNTATANYEVDVTNAPKTFMYDANGNVTWDGTRTFEWNASNQLVAINAGAHRSEFGYDGQQRRVRMVEKENSTVVSDDHLVWDRNEIAERRDNSGSVVTARLYRHGLQENGVARYMMRDHLMSIREVTDAAVGLQARYEYTPYGTVTKIAGSSPDFLGFTGVLVHEASGLFLMKRRAYDTALARWLSEDPEGMQDGPNLYSYVVNDPLRWIDPDGTVAIPLPWQPNGNVGNWFRPQDNVCSQPMGALGFDGVPCIKKCCQAHDACYDASKCNWTSWLTIEYDSACTRCNRTVAVCILNADIRPDACSDCEKK